MNSRNPKEMSLSLNQSSAYPFLLDCKENLPPTLAPKSHASNQTIQTPPSSCHENVLPVLTASSHQQSKVARKPLPFAPSGSSMGQAQALAASVLVQSAVEQQLSPLPPFTWTDSAMLWQKMRSKDSCKPAPETDLHIRHPCILPSMRTILLDWMLEV